MIQDIFTSNQMLSSRLKLLVFPTSRSIREYVNSQKEFNTLLPQIITIDEFFKRVLIFENRKLIDEEEKFLLLKEAVKNIDTQKLGINSNFSSFIKQSDYIYRFFLELASENVDIKTIDLSDTYGFYGEHLQLLKEIKKNYLEQLDKNLAVDRINMSKYFAINEEFIKRYDSIHLEFEGYFTSYEFEIVKEVSKLEELTISFIYNEFNKKSIEKFIDYGIDLEINNEYKISLSKKEVLEKFDIEKKIDKLEIKGFSSRINQIAFIKKSLVDMVNSGINPSKIALILPDETFASLVSLFDKEGYFNYAMGLNIYTSRLFKIVDAIYSYLNDDEIKNLENLKHLQVDLKQINSLFKANWNNLINQEFFENIIEFLLSCEQNQELLEKFKEVIYKLYKLLFSQEERILLKDVFKLLHQKLSKIALDDINSGKVTVMGLLESRKISFEGIIICDFNESLIPKRSLKDKFLSTQLKRKVNLPTSLDRENLQKYYYERLITTCPNVYISYVKNDSDHISRFANTLFKNKIDENLYDNQYKHMLYNNLEIKHFNKEVVLDINLSQIVWSASSLKQFLECKRMYYLNHILKIKEHELSLKPKGYELGNIIHETLEEYYKQEERTYEQLLFIFNKKRSENSFLNLDLEIWKRKLEEFVNLEKNRFEEGFQIQDLEKPFLINFNGIKLRGTIDRIDKLNDDLYVLDYKTSSNLKVNSKRNFETSVDFQLEFYYLAVQTLFKTDNIKTFYYDLHNMKLREEVVLDDKLKLLEEILSAFNTTKVNFEKCDNNQICQYCIYKTICNKD